jgi:hypothetical protein
MVSKRQILRAYIDHFLPREVVGPVLIVFSLEGVIDGIFSLYVPDGWAIVGWAIVFVGAIVLVSYWGTVDEQAVQDLHDQIEDIKAESTPEEDG